MTILSRSDAEFAEAQCRVPLEEYLVFKVGRGRDAFFQALSFEPPFGIWDFKRTLHTQNLSVQGGGDGIACLAGWRPPYLAALV